MRSPEQMESVTFRPTRGQRRYRNAHTTVDAGGLSTSSLFGRHSCSWSEVSNISCKTDRGEGPTISRIKIHRRAGRSFTLPAPTDSSARANRNPEFALQLATIRSYWASNPRPASLGQS